MWSLDLPVLFRRKLLAAEIAGVTLSTDTRGTNYYADSRPGIRPDRLSPPVLSPLLPLSGSNGVGNAIVPYPGAERQCTHIPSTGPSTCTNVLHLATDTIRQALQVTGYRERSPDLYCSC